MTDILIIGAGPAGLTAAIYAARAGRSVTVIEGTVPGGQVATTPAVENYPGIPYIAGMDLSDAMAKQARELPGVTFVTARVTSLSLVPGALAATAGGENIPARALILAMGAKRRTLDCPGEAEFAGRGVSYCATCDGNFFRKRNVCVVGGGEAALEDALHLSRICASVTLIHRRDEFRATARLQAQLRESGVKVLTPYTVARIEGGPSVESVTVAHAVTGETVALAVRGVFVCAGTVPATETVRDALPLDEAGYILAGEDGVTPIPGVFAAGDLRAKPLRQIVTAAADGAVAAVMADRFLG